jgi:protein SCO1/2
VTPLRQALIMAAPAALGLALFLVGSRPHATPVTAHYAAALPARSMYGLSGSWQSDDGQSLELADLSGRVQVLALIFTRCASVCPTLVKDLQGIAARLPGEQRERVELTLVTIDPEHDSVEVLRAYRKRMGLDARWRLLRGSEAQVRELAAALGISYSNEPGQLPLHSRLITVLDAEGNVVHQQRDVSDDAERMLRAVGDAT